MPYVLIIIFMTYGKFNNVTTQDFNQEQTCKEAERVIKEMDADIKTKCVRK